MGHEMAIDSFRRCPCLRERRRGRKALYGGHVMEEFPVKPAGIQPRPELGAKLSFW